MSRINQSIYNIKSHQLASQTRDTARDLCSTSCVNTKRWWLSWSCGKGCYFHASSCILRMWAPMWLARSLWEEMWLKNPVGGDVWKSWFNFKKAVPLVTKHNLLYFDKLGLSKLVVKIKKRDYIFLNIYFLNINL